MTKVFLAILLGVTPSLLAQETPPARPGAEEAAPAQGQPQATPAPQLGHPLDPADVAVLTGKAKGATASTHPLALSPYGYAGYGYPVNVAQTNPSLFAQVTTASRPPFVPLLFGRAGRRSFFLFGNTTSFAPPLFFFTSGRGARSTMFFAPARPGLFLLGR